MSASDSVMNDVLETLRGIRVESGFRNTAAEVTERPASYERIGRFPTLCVESLKETVRLLPGRRRRRTIRLRITGFVRVSAGGDKYKAARDLLADVEDALMGDPTRGGTAVSTNVSEAVHLFAPDEQGGRTACVVEIVTHEAVG